VCPGDVIGQEALVAPAEPAFLELQVAPFRRAFLVRHGDKDQLFAAFLGAVTIWGGTRCPSSPTGLYATNGWWSPKPSNRGPSSTPPCQAGASRRGRESVRR
jgi:hypothetical protein